MGSYEQDSAESSRGRSLDNGVRIKSLPRTTHRLKGPCVVCGKLEGDFHNRLYERIQLPERCGAVFVTTKIIRRKRRREYMLQSPKNQEDPSAPFTTTTSKHLPLPIVRRQLRARRPGLPRPTMSLRETPTPVRHFGSALSPGHVADAEGSIH